MNAVKPKFFQLSFAVLVLAAVSFPAPASARDDKWVATWSTSPQGPYPVGFAVGQPLLKYALPNDEAREQSFRLIVHPSITGNSWRVRLSNNFGNKPVVFGRAFVGVQSSGAIVEPGTNRQLTFSGKASVTVAPGTEVYSDRVHLEGVEERADLALAVSLYVRGASGAMTWHAAAFTTSYISKAGGGDHTGEDKDTSYVNSTTSWFWLDGIEVKADRRTETVVAFGDSITDGFFSTLNGEDRWMNFLDRRLKARFGHKFSIVNEAIGGNMVTSAQRPPPGCTPCDGVPAGDRLQRDVFEQAGVTTVIWLEGINDIGGADAKAAAVIDGYKKIVKRMHDHGLRVIGATLTPSTGTAFNDYGTTETDRQRRIVNEFIRHGGLFDGVVDFDAAVRDPAATGYIRADFNINSTIGGVGDHLHPSRPGFVSMANAFDLSLFH